ncbi:DNA-processing protein DprA [Cognataquiflexum rubidum]|uniref:DNA-processing protein DprA n=1 Tax=Cognataquiflexum rubidum TaxID=2922273 RepID=UPI001F13A6FF|nr:DNA-processing protein DprA [Cognataquiflexum rubidum]MCH6234407.1 DNA-processing protein DprA [Cognataquiflexum rubidum]
MSNPNSEDLIFELTLNLIPKIGPSLYRNILAYTGSARDFFDLPLGKISKIPRLSAKLAEIRKEKDVYLKEAAELISNCEKKGIRILTFSDPDFPTRLKVMDDCPMVLYTKGQVNLNPNRSVAIVGTRNATEYGKNITKKIIEDLSPYHATIISGLAYGVDIEAHKTALSNNLPTLGILGSSVDQIYPALHKSTAEQMMENGGGLISEYPPGTVMHPSNFPRRNRIISGLSDAVIVVEAAQKGGALITAEIAFSYNKEVFAVPGNLLSPYSEGCNNLIRSMKATIYTGPKDLEEALSWSKENLSATNTKTKMLDLSKYNEEEKSILQLLMEKKELEIDQIAILLNFSISSLASNLLNLEFEGLIKSLPGKKYKLI